MAAQESDARERRFDQFPGQTITAASADDEFSAAASPDAASGPLVQSAAIVQTAVASAPDAPALAYRGVNYVGDVDGSFAAADSLSNFAAVGVNSVAITADFGIDAANNTVYDNDVAGGYTESNADIAATTAQAVGDGLAAMVRPLIDFLPANYLTNAGGSNPKNGGYGASEFRSYYYPGAAGSAGANSFFASYQTMIVQQAALAQQNGAQLFCIGSELDQITGPSYEGYWDDIIAAVRAVFGGKLTYAADWDDAASPWQYAYGGTVPPLGTGDITTQVSFWNKLDYVGIDEYAPISDAADPTLQQLIAGWTQTPTDAQTLSITGQQSLISYDESIAAATGKPLLITELGYADSTDAAINPSSPGYDQAGNPDGATADPTLQADLYRAFFDAWAQDGNGSLAGVYVWNWEPAGGGASTSLFNINGTTAAESAVAAGYDACYAAGTRIATPVGEVAVERLRPGHPVLTAGGRTREVVWLGHRRVRFGAGHRASRPVRIRAHAFAAGRPRRDLLLSPEHAVFVRGMLIPAGRLVNGTTISHEQVARIAYWHVELATHDILLAEGLPAESYLDTGNRAAFANAAGPALRASRARDAEGAWGSDACAALVEHGPVLDAVRADLDARARSLGFGVAGALDIVLERSGSARVDLARGVSAVRLASAAAYPPGDRRRLGALVSGLRIDGRNIAMDHPVFAGGFHAVEIHGEARVRWTDGMGMLGLGPAQRERVLQIDVAAVMGGGG